MTRTASIIPALLAAHLVVTGSSSARAEGTLDYATQVKPVLQSRCFACHGALKQEAGLRLDAVALAIKGGDSGAAIKPGDPSASPLLSRVMATEESERMPQEGEPLSSAQIAAIRVWIAQGAKAPPDDKPERNPRDHWAFKTPVRPAVPSVANPDWRDNPIDAFVATNHQKHGLIAQRPADKRLWLRRVSLDLVGLPPTREDVSAFLADNSAQAYDKVVTRLLDSPQHGERWGRHWMDIWRYSDWWGLGAEVRNSQKHIWHWRDWIVESLNADKGYDQMLREMLAADELYPNDLDRLRASGFLARQYFKFNRTSWLDETVEHTSKAMLGLTFNCAKCHDHKYDPISQVAYYQLRAVFEPYQVRTDALPGATDFEKDGIPRAYDCNLDAKTFVHIRGDDRNPDKSRAIEPSFPTFLAVEKTPIESVKLPLEAFQPGLRPFVVAAHVKAAEYQIAQARDELARAKATLAQAEQMAHDAVAKASTTGFGDGGNQGKPVVDTHNVDRAKLEVAIAEKVLVAAEARSASIKARAAADHAKIQQPRPEGIANVIASAVRGQRRAAIVDAEVAVLRAEHELFQLSHGSEKAENSHKKKRDDTQKQLDAAKKALETAKKELDKPGDSYASLPGSLKTLESNLETEESRGKPFPTTSTGRRTALAKWITDAKNPLPARVAVNHIWARHMGHPLVPTMFDFGRKGTPPTHPELLDWLAVELTEHGWSMKHIHRLIVTSNTYRMTSSSAGAAANTLAADPENRYYWRSNPIRMEAQLVRDSLLHLAGELDPTRGGPSIPAGDETSRRRSLYFVHSHNEHHKFLSMFDDASVLDCYRRAESIVPQQALTLQNSPLAEKMAEKIAQRIAAASPGASDRDFTRAAFSTVLAIEPSEIEQATALDALQRLTDLARKNNRPNPANRARTSLVHALLNHNDFVTVR